MRTKAAKAVRSRDPEKTRARILAAATNEFAAKGFDGARVDTIARRAKTNKRMLYHYFGDKKALFEAIVGKLLSEKEQIFGGPPLAIEDKLALSFKSHPNQSKWLRLLLWESLAYGEGPVLAERVRAEAMERGCEKMRAAQLEAGICPKLPTEHVTLALMAMSMFPHAFPQLTRMLTGTAPSDPEFQATYSETLRAIVRRLKREKATPLREVHALA